MCVEAFCAFSLWLPLLEFAIGPVPLPKQLDGSDYIGTVALRGAKGELVPIRLYAFDTDSSAEKRLREARDGEWILGGAVYPNIFSLEAMYKDACGRWAHKTIYQGARVRLVQIVKWGPEAVEIRFRPNFIIRIDPARDSKEQMKEKLRLNQPFPRSLMLVNGVPTLGLMD